MPTPSGSQFKQLELFDGSAYEDRGMDNDPGSLSFDDWIASPDVVYHGTFRPDFHEAPSAHYGTLGQAAEFVGPWKADTPGDSPGRVYARRMTVPRDRKAIYTDQQANAGDIGFRFEEGDRDLPESLRQSARGVDMDLVQKNKVGQSVAKYKDKDTDSRMSGQVRDSLKRGIPVEYDNEVESKNTFDDKHNLRSTSFVVPKTAATSWERDVLASSRASQLAKQFAQQRIDSGKEGSVPFPANRYSTRPNEQGVLPVVKSPYMDLAKILSGQSNEDDIWWETLKDDSDPMISERRTRFD
jgi:hypothetical protein